jgi:hypothetical protein
MMELDERVGHPTLSEDWVRDSLDARIIATQDRLRVEQSLRTVILASPEQGVITQPAAVSPSA